MGKLIKFEFQSKKGKAEELVPFFTKILPEARSFPGNTDVKAARSLEKKQINCRHLLGARRKFGRVS